MPCGRWEGYGALLMWEAQSSLPKLWESHKIWTWPWVWALDLCVHRTPQQECITSQTGECAAQGHWEWGCKDSRFSWSLGPHGGSLLSPAGSPNKALPPQFTSPNEKVVYELEAGKVQHSQCAIGTGRPSQAQSSPLPLHPWCFPSQSTRAAMGYCLLFVDSMGCQFLMESTALKADIFARYSGVMI